MATEEPKQQKKRDGSGMSQIISACVVVLRQTFRPLAGLHGVRQLLGNLLSYLSIPASGALAFGLQSYIPGVKNLYPLVFPLIIVNFVLTRISQLG